MAPSVMNDLDLTSVWEQIDELLQGMNVAASPGFVIAPLGFAPSISWSHTSPTRTDQASPDGGASDDIWKRWLLACREVELTALLQHGRGIWKPRHYHYRLPSGRHSATFVRLGDAVRSVRDADVLAWWLHEHAVEHLGVVLDTPTIVPIVLALRNSMAVNGLRLGETVSLASYPATSLEFTASVGRARRRGGSILALLSVNSSGSVRDRLLDALQRPAKMESDTVDDPAEERPTWAQHTFVDKMDTETYHLDSNRSCPDDRTSVWSSHGERAEMTAEDCRLCNDPTRSRTVQIDPKSFDGLVLPDPVLVTPDIRVADSARLFWHLCDQCRALSLDDDPHTSVAPIRPHGGRMGVVVDYDDLLQPEVTVQNIGRSKNAEQYRRNITIYPRSELAVAVKHRLDEQRKRNVESGRISSRKAIEFIRSAELIVCLEHELNRADGGGRKFIRKMASECELEGDIVSFDVADRERNRRSESAIRKVGSVCIIMLGVVTGTSLHQTLAWIQEVRRKKRLERCDVGVLVVHLRPSSWREREVIVNPFGDDRVVAAFESVLPEGPSPIAMERKLLEEYENVESITSLRFYGDRLRYLRGEVESDTSGSAVGDVFWGLREGSDIGILRPGSLFGERLSARATLMAVGSGIQRRRHHDKDLGEIPEWRQFEMLAIFASYFDCLIVCSILRWLDKEECWWGRESGRSGEAIVGLLNRYTDEAERAVVLGELLLAAAMGKVPNKAIDVIIDRSNGLIGEAEAEGASSDSELDVEPLRLGLALLHPKNSPTMETGSDDALEDSNTNGLEEADAQGV